MDNDKHANSLNRIDGSHEHDTHEIDMDYINGYINKSLNMPIFDAHSTVRRKSLKQLTVQWLLAHYH